MPIQPPAPTDEHAHPAFRDAAGCRRWLVQLRQLNPQLAHAQLLAQIGELNRFDMPYLMRFQTLETLREPVAQLQLELAPKLAARPLPLHDAELKLLAEMVQLWQAMENGYHRCLHAAGMDDDKLATLGALLSQRCLCYSGAAILEYLRSGYECSPGLWARLHGWYAYAEQQNLHRSTVQDELNGLPATSSCRDTYVKILLASYAQPAGLTRARQLLLDRWLQIWSGEIGVDTGFSISKGDAPPLTVDINGGAGLQPVRNTVPGASMRYLAMVPMSKLLRIKLILLQQGKTPHQVGLGEQVSSGECVEFLNLLHKYWCEDTPVRLLESQKREHPAQLCSTFGHIYFALSGKLLSRARAQPDTARPQHAMLESWVADNESLLGARCTQAASSVTRMSAHQLVALRSGGDKFKLAEISWLQVTCAGRLQMGVSFLPGVPEPVSICATGADRAAQGNPDEAFLLPALEQLNIPSSLIVPRDWFHAGREIEVLRASGAKECLRMGYSVERGLDFERVSYAPV